MPNKSSPLKDMTNTNLDSYVNADGIVGNDEEKRKVIRYGYQQLLDMVQEQEESQANEDLLNSEMFHEITNRASELYDEVRNPQEALLDAEVLRYTSRLVRKKGEGLQTNVQQFKMSEYADKIVNSMVNLNRDGGAGSITATKWATFGRFVRTVFSSSPHMTYMFGSFEETQVEKPFSQRRVTQKPNVENLVETQASQLFECEDSENRTEALVISTGKILKEKFKLNGRKPLNYFKFVVNPRSFGETIENIFHVSFLIKEGKAKIEIDEDTGLPVIHPIKNSSGGGEEISETEVERYQVVINMTMKDWSELRESLNIVEAMITHCNTKTSGESREKKIRK